MRDQWVEKGMFRVRIDENGSVTIMFKPWENNAFAWMMDHRDALSLLSAIQGAVDLSRIDVVTPGPYDHKTPELNP